MRKIVKILLKVLHTYLSLMIGTLEIETKDEERFKCSVRWYILRFCSFFLPSLPSFSLLGKIRTH